MRVGQALLSIRRREILYVGTGAVASAVSGANPTPGYPSNLQAGDLLWLPVGSSGNNLFASNAVSGFTRKLNVQSTTVSPVIAGFYKIATGSESGTVTVTNPASGNIIAKMYAYRNVDQGNPFDVADATFSSGVGVTNYDIPTQTPVNPGVVALLAALTNSTTGTWTQPANHTELFDGTNGEANSFFNGHRLNLIEGTGLSSGATGTRTIVKSVSVRGVGYGLLLRPAP